MPVDAAGRLAITRIVLTGFMGCGKSTVGQALATLRGWRLIDLDQTVELAMGASVPQIFAEQGEAVFRAAEVRGLRTLLTEEQVVIALGGGAPGTAEVRAMLHGAPRTAVVHLDAPFETLYARCVQQSVEPEATARPLLGDREAAARRYAAREGVYREIAGYTVDTAAGSPSVVAKAITRLLKL